MKKAGVKFLVLFSLLAATACFSSTHAQNVVEEECVLGKAVWTVDGRLEGTLNGFGVVTNRNEDGDVVTSEGVNLTTGEIVWTREPESILLRPRCFLPPNRVVGVRDNSNPVILDAYDIATGETIWEVPVTGQDPFPTVSCREDLRYIYIKSGNVVTVVARFDGTVQWSTSVPEDVFPAFESDTVIVFSRSDLVVAYSVTSGNKLWENSYPSNDATAQNYGSLLVLSQDSTVARLDPVTGEEIWQADGQIGAFPADPTFAPFYVRQNNGNTITRLSGQDGTPVWSGRYPDSQYTFLPEDGGISVISPADASSPSSPKSLVRLNKLTGEPRYSFEFGPNSTFPSLELDLVGEFEQAYLSVDNIIQRLDFSGNVRWSHEESGVVLPPAGGVLNRFDRVGNDDDEVYFLYSTEGFRFSDQGFISLDRETGEKVWEFNRDSIPFGDTAFFIEPLAGPGDLAVLRVGFFETKTVGMQRRCP